jgi:dienelactone hydrolase
LDSRYLTDREAAVFAAGVGLAILHVIDDAFVGKQPGTTAGDHLLAAGVLLVVLGGSLALYPRLRAGARAALAVGLGILITTAGAMHVVHAVVDEAERSDFTGILAAIGGVALVALGLVVAWRAPAAASWKRRWGKRGAIAAGALLVGFYVVFPIAVAIFVTHKFREPIDGTFAVPHENVSFETDDGLTLRGWYAPSRNGAAVVLVHGSGGSRLGPRKHARLLAEHGYGVLLYDGRGRGESDGDTLGFTWTWQPDVDAAVEYVKSRSDVDDSRIGALGLSGGAMALIESAARRADLQAVVAEGAGARAYGDPLDVPDASKWVTVPYTTVLFAASQVLSGWPEARSVGDFVGVGRPDRVFLIAAGEDVGSEYQLNRIWAERTRGRVQLWELPDGKHTGALEEESEEYERRVIGFFDRRLLRSS